MSSGLRECSPSAIVFNRSRRRSRRQQRIRRLPVRLSTWSAPGASRTDGPVQFDLGPRKSPTGDGSRERDESRSRRVAV